MRIFLNFWSNLGERRHWELTQAPRGNLDFCFDFFLSCMVNGLMRVVLSKDMKAGVAFIFYRLRNFWLSFCKPAKRHLLTTGWSVFVSAKRFVAGDSMLFIWWCLFIFLCFPSYLSWINFSAFVVTRWNFNFVYFFFNQLLFRKYYIKGEPNCVTKGWFCICDIKSIVFANEVNT